MPRNPKPIVAGGVGAPVPLTVHAPTDTHSFWDREDCRYWLLADRPLPVTHVVPESVDTAIQNVAHHAAFTDARSVLIVDDGVCGPLRDIAARSGKTVFVLDPLTGCVIPDRLVAELRARRKVRVESFKPLPKIDLFITGCATYTNLGYAHTPEIHLVMAYRALCGHSHVNANTRHLVIADARQLSEEHHGVALFRAHLVASAVGVEVVERKPAKLPSAEPPEAVDKSVWDRVRLDHAIEYKAALVAEQLRLFQARFGFDPMARCTAA